LWANEFTQMNVGMERRPFKVLTPPERATAMVIARYSNRQLTVAAAAPAQEPAPDLLWKAVRVGSICAACAFIFFFLSQRNLFRRGGDALGPLPDSIQRLHFAASRDAAQPALPADAKTVLAPLAPQTFALPDARNLAVTEFNLSVTPDFQSVGNVELKLMGVNAAANTYDITVKTDQREFYRQDVKLEEHVPLAKNGWPGPELVVGAISPNRVFGYLSEPLRRGHRRRHRR
jgi:hypothetical protein